MDELSECEATFYPLCNMLFIRESEIASKMISVLDGALVVVDGEGRFGGAYLRQVTERQYGVNVSES